MERGGKWRRKMVVESCDGGWWVAGGGGWWRVVGGSGRWVVVVVVVVAAAAVRGGWWWWVVAGSSRWVRIHNAQVKRILSLWDALLTLFQRNFGYLFSDDIVATMEKYNNEAAESVMEKANKLCKEFKVEMRVESGDARDVICQVAEKLDVNLVVMGSHGYGLIKRWVYHHFSTFD
ncbi:hypothetical protein HYC85_004204 [Camellia sinensis]|uniref:UspA domain-containing protein n=1 Tax=Camellia sinensis TaxID=4442 RepID=A0A7J7HWF1_CAMSI|nr:hypothetical protein HYC85_004204 [Camellia sinensis]